MISNIFDFITTEENSYKSTPIPVADGYEWHMPEHIKACTLYKDGKLLTGNSDDKPVKNIILPILNVNYRTEGFDVKDVELYVNNPDHYHKSLILRKFHEKFARKYGLDTMIDDIVVSYVDYGGALLKKIKKGYEVIPLQKLAFCDQTDILSGPFAIKHQYTIDQLKERENVWDKDAINELIEYSISEKSVSQANEQRAKTTGRYIEVYEVHGTMPKSWLTDDENDEMIFVSQVHIVSFKCDENRQKRGITLYRGLEKKNQFKVLRRDKRFGTALGRSAIEELIEPQVWVNYSMIQIKQMLDKAAIMLATVSDTTTTSENNFSDLEKGTIIKGDVKPFAFPVNNLQTFENFLTEFENHARITGSASEPQMGINPASGTPLGTTQIVTSQGEGIHDYRRGQIATFVEELYREGIIPDMADELSDEQTFMATFSLEELQEISNNIVTNHVNREVAKKIMEGNDITKEQAKTYEEFVRKDFEKRGNKRFIEMLKDEFTDLELDVVVNVAGKQKNMAVLVQKLSNIFRQILANPSLLQDPNAAKLFNLILESSNISPLMFTKTEAPQQMNLQQNQLQTNKPPMMQLQNSSEMVQ